MKADINTIRENPHNPRTIPEEKFRKLVDSLRQFPEMLEARPIVVDKDNIVLGGNMRLKAAREAGLKEVPIYRSDWSHDKSSEFVIKDNVGFGEWDWDLLANEWDVYPLAEWGLDVWTPEEENEGLTDPDEVPEVPADAVTQLGDLWILGEHRLLCGDSTKAEDMERLMNGEKADMIFTDPPYGISLGFETPEQAKARNRRVDGLKVKNDDLQGDDLQALLTDSLALAVASLNKGGAFYICSPIGKEVRKFIQACEDNDLHYQSGLVWNKSSLCLSRHDYHPKHEIIHYGWKKGDAHNWFTDRKQTSVYDFDKPSRSESHPTSKPVELVSYFIGNVSKQGFLVIDSFLGSGSTLIAAEKTGRKCYGMELDPKYCDVIIKRWEDFTGQKASKANA